MKLSAVFLAGFAAATLTGVAHAGLSNLHNTGLNAGGVDPYWTLDTAASSTDAPISSSTYDSVVNNVFPQPPYIANSATSGWATPLRVASPYPYDAGSDGTYVYQVTFNASSTGLAQDFLNGQFAADNAVSLITLNGHTIFTGPSQGAEYDSWTGFSAAAGSGLFVAGQNTLQFTLVNDQFAADYGNPAGLNVQFTSFLAAPEPDAWALMLAGVLGVGAALRLSRRRTIAAV